jgi:hypothetical protein
MFVKLLITPKIMMILKVMGNRYFMPVIYILQYVSLKTTLAQNQNYSRSKYPESE